MAQLVRVHMKLWCFRWSMVLEPVDVVTKMGDSGKLKDVLIGYDMAGYPQALNVRRITHTTTDNLPEPVIKPSTKPSAPVTRLGWNSYE